MKTPKVATPMPRLKLNTPRSGFIRKSNSSVKKGKVNFFENSGLEINGTPRNDIISFKKVKPALLNNSSTKKNKSPINNINKSPVNKSPINNVNKSPVNKSPINNINKSPVNKSPFNNKQTPENKNQLKTPKLSPLKRKVINSKEDGDENLIKKQKSPKTENTVEKKHGKKIKNNNKASPEVQLGLDIEQFLHKNSSNNVEKNTPLGTKQINKVNKTIDLKSNNKGNKKIQGNFEGEIKKTQKSEYNELVPQVTLKNAVNALVKYVKENPKERNEIFGLEIPFYLTVNYSQVPATNRSRIWLPNSVLLKNPDVCLIVSDKKGNEIQDPDDVIDECKEFLRKYGIIEIPEIFPWDKACKENTQFEQKQKFMDRFDLVLVEKKLMRLFSKWFGFKCTQNKAVVPFTLAPDQNLKEKMDRAFNIVSVFYKGKGLTKTIKFGHDKMCETHLVENLDAILKEITNKSFLHGNTDIRSIMIKSQKSTGFPLYMSIKSRASGKTVNKDIEKSKKEDVIEGELSTFIDKIVSVYKDGTVKTRKIKPDEEKNKIKKNKPNKQEDEDDDDEEDVDDDEEDLDDDEEDVDDDEEDMDDDEENVDDEEENLEFENDADNSDETVSEDDEEINNLMKNKKPQKQKNIKGIKSNKVDEEYDDDESEDDQLDAAEEIFLKELRRQQDNIESKNSQKKGNSPSSHQSKKSQGKVVSKQKEQQQKLRTVPQKNESQKKNQQQQQNNKKWNKGKNIKFGKNNQTKDGKNSHDDDQLDDAVNSFLKGIKPEQNQNKSMNLQKKGKMQLQNQSKKLQEKVVGSKQTGGVQKFVQKGKSLQQTNVNKENMAEKTVAVTSNQAKNKRKRNKKNSNPVIDQASTRQTKVLTSPKVNPKGKKPRQK